MNKEQSLPKIDSAEIARMDPNSPQNKKELQKQRVCSIDEHLSKLKNKIDLQFDLKCEERKMTKPGYYDILNYEEAEPEQVTMD